MGVQRYNFLRILRAMALTSFVCFSSSVVYAMDGEDAASALRGITLLERSNSNEWSKIHCEITMPERLLLKFETHEVNKPEDRVSFTEYLEDLHLDEYLLLNF